MGLRAGKKAGNFEQEETEQVGNQPSGQGSCDGFPRRVKFARREGRTQGAGALAAHVFISARSPPLKLYGREGARWF